MQLTVAMPQAQDHTASNGTVVPQALLSFPSIDEAARQDVVLQDAHTQETDRQHAWNLAPFSSSMSAAPNTAEDAEHYRSAMPQFSLAGFASRAADNQQHTYIASLPTAEIITADDAAVEVSPPSVPFATRAREQRLKKWLGRHTNSDYGLAYDRVMFAPIATPTTLGVPSAGLSFRHSRGASSPDRLEYLWSRAGKGPAAESGLDVLDSVFRTELGSARAVLISEISMRSLDPERAPNTTGFGDMVVGGKTLVMDGKCTKLSTIFLTYLNTGPVDRGLGTGHVSLEPGLLGMHQWSERTFLHGAINYRIPIAATRGFAGDVLTSSWAISTIWQDHDDYAWIPVLEFQTHSFLFGAQTEPNGSVRRVDGTTALDILPGSRWSLSRSALGACELGVSGGFRCSDADWFDSRIVLDVRWLR